MYVVYVFNCKSFEKKNISIYVSSEFFLILNFDKKKGKMTKLTDDQQNTADSLIAAAIKLVRRD